MTRSISSPITWFEIPTKDIDSAVTFYQAALQTNFKRQETPDVRLAVFSADGDAVKGALAQGKGLEPRDHGVVVYLQVPDTIEATCRRWEAGGGKVVTPVIELPDRIGRIVQAIDAEGGRVALHEPGPGIQSA